MHISKITLSSYKSFKHTSQLTNPSKNINIIIGKNGSGKSNLISAISTFFTPNRITADEKQNLLNEGNALSNKEAKICIEFSENDRFPFEDAFSLTRNFDLKKDEYEYDVKHASNNENKSNVTYQKEEMKGLFESCNLNASHFIVQQGKINALSYLDDYERYELIKEIAGASVYERDRLQSIEMLNESKVNEEKIVSMLRNIKDHMKGLDKEREKYIEYEKLENEKRELERAMYKLEKKRIDDELEKLVVEESESDLEEIEEEVSELERKIQEKEKEINEGCDSNEECDSNDNKENIQNSVASEYTKAYNSTLISKPETNTLKDNAALREDAMNACDSNASFDEILCEKTKKLENYSKAMQKKYENVELESKKTKTEIYAVKKEQEYFENNLYTRKEKEKYKNLLKQQKQVKGKDLRSLNVLVEEKNKLWNDIAKNEKIMKKSIEEYKMIESSMIKKESSQFRVYQEIKDMKGVHGCVFEVLNIPEEIFTAVESSAGTNLYNVIVEDESVVNELIDKISGRITFLPLTRFAQSKKVPEGVLEGVNDTDDQSNVASFGAVRLADKIKCKSIYKPLLNYVTKNSYLVSDTKKGIYASKKFNVNAVTFDGDFISKSGIIKGGYKKSKSLIEELKSKENEIKRIEKLIKESNENLNLINEEIKIVKNVNEMGNEISEKGLLLFYERIATGKGLKSKVKQVIDVEDIDAKDLSIKGFDARDLSVKGSSVKDSNAKDSSVKAVDDENLLLVYANYKSILNDLEIKELNIKKEMQFLEFEMQEKRKSLEFEIKKMKAKKLKNEIKKMKKMKNLKKLKIENMKNNKFEDNKNLCILKRNVLIEKQINLNKKIGFFKNETDTETDNNENNFDDYKSVVNSIKCINEKLKKYLCVNKKINLQFNEFEDKKNELNAKINELKNNRIKIEDFINELDLKKNEAIKVTLNMVKSNFEYFYYKLTNIKSVLILEDNKLKIKIGNEENIKKLSGGQKTILSLSLIFSIQKIDSSPFYFFDEIDANLDKDARLKVSQLIKEICNENIQYFIITFRKEMIDIGDKFYCIDYQNRDSVIKEISKEEAIERTIDQ